MTDPEHSADYVPYRRRAEELIDEVHLNANEALIARLLAGIADWFVETHASDVWGRALWNVFADWAAPVTDLKALIAEGFDPVLAGRSALHNDGGEGA